MALTNAERQARHRARLQEKLRIATEHRPLRNQLLDAMSDAFNTAHKTAVIDSVTSIDERSLLPDESGWWRLRERLLKHPDGFDKDSSFFIELARASGEKLGNYLAMSIYRDFLSEEVRQHKPAPAPQTTKSRRRVT